MSSKIRYYMTKIKGLYMGKIISYILMEIIPSKAEITKFRASNIKY